MVILGLLAIPEQATGEPDQAATASDVWISIRMLPGVRQETLDYLAEVAQPLRRTVRAGDDLKALLREQYGFFNDKLWRLVRKRNPGISSLRAEADGEVELPAGPVWYFNTTTRVPHKGELWSWIRQEVGTAGSRTRGEVAQANGRTLDPAYLEEGQKLRLPYATRLVTIRLNPDFRGRPEEVLARLRTDDDVVHADLDPGFTIIRQLDSAELASVAASCSETAADGSWPFDAAALHETLATLPKLDRVTVAVVDSGIAPDDARLPLWQNLLEAIGEDGVDDDGNHYLDDVVGADVPALGFFPNANVGSPAQRAHGTHVAGLVLGGHVSEPLLTELHQRIQLMILKVLRQIGPLNEVSEGALANAILYASGKRAGIVNLSLVGPSSEALSMALHENKGLLFVVAAGNGRGFEGLDLDVEEVYPARYGGLQSENVITVAAHDGHGAPTCFSNFGATTVDLAAPGLEIESTVPGNGYYSYSGTSQAAPLVSLTAALLMSVGVSEPRLIKQRILSTVDYVPGLRGKMVSEGKLNIVKAILIEDDLVQLHNGELKRGKIIEPAAVSVGGQMIPLRRVKKIVLGYSDDSQEAMRVTLLEKGKLRSMAGPSTIDKIVLRQAEGDIVLAADEVVDIIPALRPRRAL